MRQRAAELLQKLGRGASDAEEFASASKRKDIAEFTRLMDSTEPVEPSPERLHPWAADPRSVRCCFGQTKVKTCLSFLHFSLQYLNSSKITLIVQ